MKEYKNEQITVYWRPELCAHSRKCIDHLPEVFDAGKRPWIDIQGSSPEKIIELIDRCPSGALRYSIPEGSQVDPEKTKGPGNIANEKNIVAPIQITVSKNGPLLVRGPAEVVDPDGNTIRKADSMALCRCGYSRNRPFCDGSHKVQGWHPDSE